MSVNGGSFLRADDADVFSGGILYGFGKHRDFARIILEDHFLILFHGNRAAQKTLIAVRRGFLIHDVREEERVFLQIEAEDKIIGGLPGLESQFVPEDTVCFLCQTEFIPTSRFFQSGIDGQGDRGDRQAAELDLLVFTFEIAEFQSARRLNIDA